MSELSANQVVLVLMALQQMLAHTNVRVIGRTSYRTARVADVFMECTREQFEFMEDMLPNKDNHVVLIFQVLYGNKYIDRGIYYALLHDGYCLIGRTMIVEDF